MDTSFSGRFNLDKPLTEEHRQVLADFWDEEHEYEDGRRGGPGMPEGHYCQWMPTEDGKGLEWDGVEKFYYYVEWLEYLIAHFLGPWGYVLNGSVKWLSTIYEPSHGTIIVYNSVVTAAPDLSSPQDSN